MPDAYEIVGRHGSGESLCNASAEKQRLVVATASLFARMERYGNDDVDIVEEVAASELEPHLSSHCDGKRFVAAVFDLVEQTLSVVALRKEEQRGGCHVVDASHQAVVDDIVLLLCGERFWEGLQAVEADVVFAAEERSSAEATGAREEEFYEVAEEGQFCCDYGVKRPTAGGDNCHHS